MITSTIAPDALRRTLVAIVEGESGFSRIDAMRMLNAMRRGSEREIARPDGELALLTHREHEIYLALANGTSTRVIADHLHLTEGTVRWHAARLMKKLRVTSRMDLADDRPTPGSGIRSPTHA